MCQTDLAGLSWLLGHLEGCCAGIDNGPFSSLVKAGCGMM